MACCLYFFQGSKYWVALIIPIFAVIASFSSSGHEFTLFAVLVLLSTLFFLTFINKKPILPVPKEFSAQENIRSSSSANLHEEDAEILKKNEELEENEEGVELYSESESIDEFFSSDAEQKLDYSDESISDEEGDLIEIAITSGQFVYPAEKDQKFKKFDYCYKYLSDMCEMNDEDNLIEIDIYMGSIKYSSVSQNIFVE